MIFVILLEITSLLYMIFLLKVFQIFNFIKNLLFKFIYLHFLKNLNNIKQMK